MNELNQNLKNDGCNCRHRIILPSECGVQKSVSDEINKKNKHELFVQSRKSVIDYAKSNIVGKKVYRKELNGNIEFTKKGVKEALNQRHEKYVEKNKAIKDIVELLKNAPYIESVENYKKGKKPTIVRYHYFGINIVDIPSQIVIEENNLGRLVFYSITKEKPNNL